MSPASIAVIALGMMLFFVFLGMPIGFSMAISGLLGLVYFLGWSIALTSAVITFYGLVSDYAMTVLPLFILMGGFAATSGMSSDLYMTAEKWFRRLPGGLALATIAGCAGFASICGSNAATSATMGTIALPEMKKFKYADSLATGTIAASGTLGFLIPPSSAFIIYAVITEESAGRLLIAGFLPGLMLAIAFMSIVIFWVKLNPGSVPANPTPISWKERLLSLRNVWGVVLTFLLVMGGIYLGFFTPTEAGAVGAFGLFLFALGRRRLTLRGLLDTVLGVARTTGMIFTIIFGAFIFNDLIALSGMPAQLAAAIGGLAVSPYIILLLILGLFLVLGCFIESIPMMILLVPFILPIILDLGFSAIWFGVIMVLLVNAAQITPPIGVNVFIVSGVAKGVPASTIFRGAMPFLIAIVVVMLLLIPFPQIATFLPDAMIG